MGVPGGGLHLHPPRLSPAQLHLEPACGPGQLLLAQPLHFGDYGGAPLKLVWALLDMATIVVLGSGLYLWVKRGRAARKTLRADALGDADMGAGARETPALAREASALARKGKAR